MSVEQAIHELQEQPQRVSAGHQAIHQELSALRSMVDTRSRIRLVEPKTLMPDSFGKKNGPGWRTWSHLARDFVGVVHATLKQAIKAAEHEFNVTNEMDQELQHFLISRTEGEALEIVREAEREPSLEQWRTLSALYDPLAAGRSLDNSKQILSPQKAAKIDDLSHTIQAWEILEQRHRERTGDQLPKVMRLAILLSVCPIDLEKELTARQHLFPDYAQLKARIVTVINNRTRGVVPMTMGNLSDEDRNHHASSDESVESDDGELYRLEIRNGKKVFTKSRPDSSKGKGEERRVKLTQSVSAVDALVTLEQIAEPKLTSMGPSKSAPERKSVENCEDEETKTSQNVPLGTIDLGSFEVLSKHGDEVDVDESTCKTTEMMPPLPPVPWFNRTETFCGKFRKPCNEDHHDEEDPFLDCWDGKQEQFDALQPMDPRARNGPKSEPCVKGCLTLNFPVRSVCQKLEVYQRLPIKAPQYDISSEGEDRPSDNSNDGEWWPDEVDLNAVTTAKCPSTANLLQQMVSEVDTDKSQLTPVQENRL